MVWIAVSKDEGKTFAKEVPVWGKVTGVCGFCQMRAFEDSKGTNNIMYHLASDGHRDVYLLLGKEGEKGIVGGVLHPWKVSMCPMSTMGISAGTDLVATTWETDGKIYLSKIRLGLPTSAPIGMQELQRVENFQVLL